MGLFTKSTSTLATETPEAPVIPGEPKPISAAVSQLIAPAPAPIAAPPVPPPAQRIIMTPVASERQIYLQGLKVKIHQKLVERLDVQNLKSMPPETVRNEV